MSTTRLILMISVLMISVLLLSGCQTPVLVFAGAALNGELKETENFAFASRFKILKLEVNPQAPYSVILRCTVINGHIYLDAAPKRRWGQYLLENPHVRVKLGADLYLATAVRISDPDILQRFYEGRAVYRLEPRQVSP